LARKIAVYAAATGGAPFTADVEGAIVYTDLGDGLTIRSTPSDPGSIDGTIGIDLDVDGQTDFLMLQWTEGEPAFVFDCWTTSTSMGGSAQSCGYVLGLEFERRYAYLSGIGGNRAFASHASSATRFEEGATISAGGIGVFPSIATLAGSSVYYNADGRPDTTHWGAFYGRLGFAGVFFEAADQAMHAGWLKIQDQSGLLTLFGFAYETAPGVPILAGDTGILPNVAGDTDGDGKVDLEDLNNVRNNFGAREGGILGDTNDDGLVDLEDLNAVRNNFGAGNPVPEPLSLVLLAAGAAGLATLRQRRGRRTEE